MQSKIMQKRRDENGNLTSFTIEQDVIIKSDYLKLPVKTLASKINKSSYGVTTRMRQLGLIVPLELIEQRKKDSRIKKGNIPLNKGKKQSEWLSPESIDKISTNWFKKGQNPHNTLADFSEVKHYHKGSKKTYWMIKTPEFKRLIHKHVWLWEREYGKVKKGFNVVFKDGETLNCVIENLECISNEELMLRNSKKHSYHTELLPKYAKILTINNKIKKIENGKN